MVRSKEVPKKPKDPLLTPPSKPRGFRGDDGRGGSLPRNRGGAAMSPSAASVPNYMRATSSSGAKAGVRARLPSSASLPGRRPVRVVVTRGKVLFPEVSGMGRATCTSTMKDAKFPTALDLAPGATDAEGPAALRVCPYTYCSLNGHAHAPAVPLRSFLASRRRLIKTQQSMKHKGVSAFRRSTGHQRPEDKNGAEGAGVCGGAKVAPLIDDEALGDFFVEVYGGPRVSSDMSCSDMSLDEMDATVRKMEFVVFDRCGEDDGNEKGNDLGICGDGEGEGRLEERLGLCRDSSSESECSDAAISRHFVEVLPWKRYGYDSLDDDVSEEQGVIDDEIVGAEVSEEQEGKHEDGTSGGFGDECEEEPKDDKEIISDLACETEIVTEQEGAGCRVETSEESTSNVGRIMEIAAEQTCTLCMVGVCKEQEERGEDNILDEACQGDTSDRQGTSEEKLSDDVYKSEIPEYEVAEIVEKILEESCKEENSVDQDAIDDETNVVESADTSEVTEEWDMKDEENMRCDESEMEISEAISNVAFKEDFSEEEVTTKVVSEGEISDFSATGSPDVEMPKQLTNGGFEQDANTVDDASEQDDTTADNEFEQGDTPADGHDEAHKELEVTTCKLEEVTTKVVPEGEISDFSATGSPDVEMPKQLTNGGFEQDANTVDDASEQDDTTADNGFEQGDIPADGHDEAHKELEVTTCKLEDGSEESDIVQESSQDVNCACVDAAAQIEPEITKCKSEDASEVSGIAQESSQGDNSAYVKDGAHTESEITTCKLEDASEEYDIAEETVYDDNSSYFIEGSQTELGIGTSELEATSEESGIAQEIGQDNNSVYVSDDAQDDSVITTCKLEDASEEYVIAQKADQGAQNESELTPCRLADTSGKLYITQEVIQDDNTSDANDGAQKESEIFTCESGDAHEEPDVTREDGHDYTSGVHSGAKMELEMTACESGGASDEPARPQDYDGHAQQKITTSKLDACEEQLPKHNYDFSTTNDHGEHQTLPAENTDAKESSIDDICNAFSGMDLKGDVYLDPTESTTCPTNRLIIARRRRTPEEEEYMRGFNPRAPNFLPLELDPDAEKVDLKHQMTEDRKNAEEWMIDYALRRAVNNLGPARKKKVELLVQAFETVLPHDEDDKKSITPTRPVQACN